MPWGSILYCLSAGTFWDIGLSSTGLLIGRANMKIKADSDFLFLPGPLKSPSEPDLL